MKLFDILHGVCDTAGLTDCDVSGVTDDSAEFAAGFIFIAVSGRNFDGHAFAIQNCRTAAAIVVSDDRAADFASLANFTNVIAVPDTRAVIAPLVSAFYGNPTRSLTLVAVTGTNGKSTFAALLRHIIVSQGHKCGVIGTIGFDVCGKVYEAHYSLPPARLLYRYFREMADNGAEYCVIEATSQALAQNRICGETFAVGAFTNLTRDHLDYHADMSDYLSAKAKLFPMCKNAVVCIDDYGKALLKMPQLADCRVTTFAVAAADCENTADVFASNITQSNNSIEFDVTEKLRPYVTHVNLPMPGGFNAQNAGLALETAVLLGFSRSDAAASLKSFGGVAGRGEVVWSGDINGHNVTVICDYAHTEDALEKIISATRERSTTAIAQSSIITLFGATGERDKGKRKPIGKLLSRMSDYTVLTSDNPNFEDPADIISQVIKGFLDTPEPGVFAAYPDRGEAVIHACEKAVEFAKDGDAVLLLCGKGHERYQTVRGKYLPFDECEIARKELEKYL